MKMSVAVGTAALTPTASRNIEWLRLFLVAQVLFGHLAMIALPHYGQLDLHAASDVWVAAFRFVTRFGQQAASAFVFLSGYFLVPRLIEIAGRRGHDITASSFLQRRLRRIYPTLIAAVFLTLACDEAGMRLLGARDVYASRFNYDPVAALTPLTMAGNLLSLQPTFIGAFGSNGPLWTLGYLVQFYVVGILLAVGWRDRPGVTLAGSAILGLAAALFRPEWLLLFLTWLGAGLVRRIGAPRGAIWLLVPATLLFVLGNRLPSLASICCVAMASTLAVIALTDPAQPPDHATPVGLVSFATVSYAIYAFHMPAALAIYAGLRRSIPMDGWIGWGVFLVVVPMLVGLLASAWQTGLNALSPAERMK